MSSLHNPVNMQYECLDIDPLDAIMIIACAKIIKSSIPYSTVSTRQLLFVWCSLSDDHQTIVRCLSYVPPDICQLPPDICQTSTTCTPDIYCTICTPDDHQTYTRHPPHICQMCGSCLVYMLYLSDRCLVGVDRCLVKHPTGIWQSSDNHLTGSTRQIATVWRKRWCTIELAYAWVLMLL